MGKYTNWEQAETWVRLASAAKEEAKELHVRDRKWVLYVELASVARKLAYACYEEEVEKVN